MYVKWNYFNRFCVRHLYANFKEQFKGKELKDAFWGAASAYIIDEWQEYMNLVKELNPKAREWLVSIDPTVWTKSHFFTRTV